MMPNEHRQSLKDASGKICGSLFSLKAAFYNFAVFLLALHPLLVAPPSSSITFPVICADPILLKNKITPAKSDGWPIRPVGCPAVSVSMNFSRPKLVMRLGKTPLWNVSEA
jgi:hypothetical protein